MIKVKFCLPRSVRIKLNNTCQYNCKFCHQEGNGLTQEVNQDEVVGCLKRFKEELFFYRVHYTGGEPTLYKNLLSLIKKTKEIGIISSITSNGQFNPDLLLKLKEAGLNSINFSIHSLEKFSFLKLQDYKMSVKDGASWAQKSIDLAVSNVINAEKLINTKVNCVVGDEFSNAEDVLLFCVKNNIKLRFLNDLSLGEKSLQTINFILKKNEANLIGHEITLISSSHRLDYQINEKYNFGVKCIRNFYLKSLCDDCPIRKEGKCYEGFYGIRLEDDPLKVRLCLYRNGAPFVQNLENFFKSEQYKELKKETENVRQYLLKDDIIEEQKIF
ncbi:MAG: radical SAM protein [Patescibacteria group bacterium]|nr:radical SAM protein [Patescibacteria group bacterium]